MIQLTRINGGNQAPSRVLVNPQHIVSMEGTRDGTRIYLSAPPGAYYVQETSEEVTRLIREAAPEYRG